jgi:hypothetical protein
MAFPNNIGPRTQPAWDAILEHLTDGDWHTHAELVMEAGLASDLTDKSIDELIRKGYRTRHYSRRVGKVPGQPKVQGAVYRLLDGDAR